MSDGAAGASKPARSIKASLLESAAIYLATALAAVTIPAHAQTASGGGPTSQVVSFNIRSQDLGSALTAFADRAGLRLLFQSGFVSGQRSPALSGSFTREQALNQLLAGTGLIYRFTSANTVTVTGPAATSGPAVVPGAIQLDTVDVSGGRVSATDVPYSTPAPVSYISQETIDRFRGSSPADIFRGTPGVMSGEARNGGGSIDVNIRGMQGMGRVAVTIDGAENNTTVYQGYQGISNRTFVDPDLLAGVDIQKGSDASSRGIAGTVAMRTLSADDVVKAGEKWGVWVKSGFGTNTTTPVPGQVGGYLYKNDAGPTGGTPGTATPSPDGLNRPGSLTPTSGSFSTVAAVKEDNYDLLWGYAFRKQGDYFAGKNGPSANPTLTGRQPYCCYGWYYGNYMDNAGLTNYRAGEQVLNTQSETESWIAKATVRDVESGQSLQIGYNGYRGKAGDMIAAIFTSPLSQPMQQAQQDTTKVDTGTARYRWNPDDNDLVDLKANLWMSNFSLRTPVRSSFAVNIKPEDFGLPYDYLPGNDSTMWGGDLSNKSHFAFDRFGALDFDYGMSYLSEATKPTPFTDKLNNIPGRDGTRQEVAGFGKLAYKPVDWLTLKSGLRYSHDWSLDRSTPTSNVYLSNSVPSREHGGYSPSAGVVLEPVKGTQFYANYSSALRMPTIFESVAAYSITVNPNLGPERSNNWEAGVNVVRDGVFASKDKAMMKFGYFNWDVKDYVARQYTNVSKTSSLVYGLLIYNIARAKFEGLEFSGRYENNGFTADLTANYYLNVEFCETDYTCAKSTLSSDYAANQIPPEYSANLTLSQKLLNDDLTIGSRVSYTGPRSVGHGAVQYGAAAIIEPIDWKPYWLVDLFAEYKLTKDITLWATAENLLDQYYVDPLSLVQQPSPGRTVRLGVTGKFGGSEPIAPVSLANLFAPGERPANWSGFHVGVNTAYNFAKVSGSATSADGTSTLYPDEAPNLGIRASSFGLMAGYDYQFNNNIVAGIEVDIAKTQIGGSQIDYANETSDGGTLGNLRRARQFESVHETEIKWMSTVRGRLGYAFNDRFMVFATGGVAFMEQDDDRTQYTMNDRGDQTTVAAFTEKTSTNRTGYVVGGGAEYKLDGGWSLSGEFQLAQFGKKETTFSDARAGVLPDKLTTPQFDPGLPGCDFATNFNACFTAKTPIPGTGTYTNVNGRTITSKINIPMIKVGLSYRF